MPRKDPMPQKEKPAKSSQKNPKEGSKGKDKPDGKSKESSNSIGIPRVISLIVLVAVLLLIGVLLFRVMASFLVPLFLAAVLAVICTPMHDWVSKKLPRRPNIAALVTTGIISLLVLAPLSWFGWKAYVETSQVVSMLSEKDNRNQIIQVVTEQAKLWETWYQQKVRGNDDLTDGEMSNNASSTTDMKESAKEANQEEALVKGLPKKSSPPPTGFDLKKTIRDSILGLSDNFVQLGLTGFKSLVAFAFGLAVMIFALYYFLADGPAMLESLMHLSPMDDDYERELLHQFARVSRAVVLATLVTAVAQGLLAGIGYYAVQFLPMGIAEVQPGVEPAAAEPILLPVFLLTVLTMLLSIVPFVGALAVWVPTVIWISFFIPGGFWPGVILAIYCTAIVSSADNVIKPLVLSGQSNLHPLLALLSVLGGVQLLGPIGILVGPMLVAFLQALLGMLRKELDDINDADEMTSLSA